MRTVIRTLVFTTVAILTIAAAAHYRAASTHPVQESRMAAPDWYTGMWHRVDSLSDNDQPKSALTLVLEIARRARSEGNRPQVIRSTAYRIALAAETTDTGELLLVDELRREIAAATTQPERAIWQSALATYLRTHLAQNMWQIAQRTRTDDTASGDFRTWDAQRFVDTTRALYLASLAPAAALQAESTERWTDILIKGVDTKDLRPTMYDLLAHRALDFFTTDVATLPAASDAFELTDPAALGDARSFAGLVFAGPDGDQLVAALGVLQELTRFHMRDGSPDAGIDLELVRLAFVRGKLRHDEKDTLYFQALERLARTHAARPIAAGIGYRMAAYLEQQGDLVRAYELAGQWAERHARSTGAADCRALQRQITQRSLAIDIERTAPPDRPIMISTGFRNLERVHFRIVRDALDDDDRTPYRYRGRSGSDEEQMRRLLAAPVVEQWNVRLPVVRDYREHRVDLRAPALPIGRYVVIASARADFALDSTAMMYAPLTVTRLSLHTERLADGSLEGRVADIESGAQLDGVRVLLRSESWSSQRSRWERAAIGERTTDREGCFRIEAGGDGRSVLVTLARGRDTLVVPEQISAWRAGPPRTTFRTMYFTDRAIYRPGQTIHFKGITLRAEGDSVRYDVVAGERTTVTLHDVNHQKIAEQTFTTNEFGSFAGSFTAPAGVLTGVMTIRSPYGSTHVRVEEYKRPTFEVTFDAMTDAVALGGEVRSRGRAVSYAGAALDGATVAWRVHRRARYPFWWWWWRPMPSSEAQEIASGSATATPDGSFEIRFTARPDRAVDPDDLPVFTYEVTADVTDINGETRSGATSVSAGYTALTLEVDAPQMVDGSRDAGIVALRAATLNGAPQSAIGNLRVERLRTPSRLVRERMLPAPDQWMLDAREYAAAFPHDAYKDEANEDLWSVEQSALAREVRIDTTGVDSVRLGRLAPGRYRLVFAVKDPSGRMLEQKRFFTVYDRSSSTPAVAQPVVYAPVTLTCEPGETARFVWGTGYPDAMVLYQIVVRNRVVAREWITFDAEQRVFEIPVTTAMRGGATAVLSFVRAGRLHQTQVPIEVPWTNTKLTVETATFRDKLTPGAQEEWRITVRGAGGAVVAAEMVAAMYDASLDAITPHGWSGFTWPHTGGVPTMESPTFSLSPVSQWYRSFTESLSISTPVYDRLNLFLLEEGGAVWGYGYGRGARRYAVAAPMMMKSESRDMDAVAMVASEEVSGDAERQKNVTDGDMGAREDESAGTTASDGGGALQVRRNFDETAFFFPQLALDERGDVVLRFTMPEALTRWRLLAFAHTSSMHTGMLERTAVTQKDLMVTPNVPRFLRHGDEITIAAKITNLSGAPLAGSAVLSLFDAVTMQPLDARFGLLTPAHAFSVEAARSTMAQWSITVPDGLTAIVYRITATTGTASDGEEAALPVLPDRMLVTESLPLPVRGNTTRTFRFEKLLAADASPTLRHQALTLEMTSNPAWYAVQSLPYLMEFPHECAEQIFNRLYANSIAAHIVEKDPKIRRIFDQWRGTDALSSNLEKNQALKSALLEETPWVLAAQSESDRKRRVGLLFEFNTMRMQRDATLRKLAQAQAANGGWPWFAGMPESRHITQYILAGFGHLAAMGVTLDDPRVAQMIERAVGYVDGEMADAYAELKRREKTLDPAREWISYLDIHYLYARSYFLAAHPVAREHREAVDFWLAQARRFWPKRTLMMQGMIALGLQRFKDAATPGVIVTSLRERALASDELGMYWKQQGGWWWHEAPIETQALMIEVFDEIARDRAAVEEMKIWLLKQKQVQDWKTTIATAEATYALLRRGFDLLASDRLVEVSLGGRLYDPRAGADAVEAGTGTYRHTWSAPEITPRMGEVTVRKSDDGIAWGALYWQYYEKLDRITPAKTPLAIEKTLYRKTVSPKGPVLEPVTADRPLRVGDVLTVKLEIRTDRDMEYVHVKDMRGAGVDLINQKSGYRWQGGLGYYEAPRDASVNFFVHWLPKGVHVFEYTLRVTHAGTFANGISTIQCMYAPEFAAHTAGITLRVE